MDVKQIKKRLLTHKVNNGIVKKIRFGYITVPYHRSKQLGLLIPFPPTLAELERNKDEQKIKNYQIRDKLDDLKKQELLTQLYLKKLGKTPNLISPRTLTEKINWMKIHYKDPKITLCCDKYRVKQYVEEALGKQLCPKTIHAWKNSREIDFNLLPERFVLKVNWSSGYNIFVKNKSALSEHEKKLIIKQLDIWTRPYSNSYYDSFNWGYKDVEPVIYAEEMLDKEYTHYEYKVFCFDGQARFVLVEVSPNETNPQRICVDNNGEELPFCFGEQTHASNIKIPKCFPEILSVAEKVAAPFKFVRVDFMAKEDSYLLGEMTFYSGGGFSLVKPIEWDLKLGDYIKL